MTRLRIPTGRRRTGWLFTCVIEGLEIGTTKNKSSCRSVRERLELEASGLQFIRSNRYARATSCGLPKKKNWYNVPFGQYIPQIHDLLQLQQDPVKKMMISAKDYIVNNQVELHVSHLRLIPQYP